MVSKDVEQMHIGVIIALVISVLVWLIGLEFRLDRLKDQQPARVPAVVIDQVPTEPLEIIEVG